VPEADPEFLSSSGSGVGARFPINNIPLFLFLLIAAIIAMVSFVKRLSLIPVLGLLTCLYLMSQLGITNWIRFLLWLVAGLAIYFLYSRKSSKLRSAS